MSISTINISRYITNNTQLDDQGKPGPLGPDFGNYLYAFISSIIYIISQIMKVRLCPGRGPRGEHLPGVARVPGARLRHLLLLHVCKQRCLLRVVDTRARVQHRGGIQSLRVRSRDTVVWDLTHFSHESNELWEEAQVLVTGQQVTLGMDWTPPQVT